MKKSIIFLVLVLGRVCFGVEVGGLLEKFPAGDSAGEMKLAEGLLGLGAEGIAGVVGKLVPLGSGDDTQARDAISAMVRYAGVHGEARKVLAAGLVEGLGAVKGGDEKNWEVKSYLLLRLQEVGGDEAVGAIAGYLVDERLGDYACAALEGIGTANAGEAVLKSLGNVKGARLPGVLRAIGAMRVVGAGEKVLPFATNDDKGVRMAALWALANIGVKSEAEGDLIWKAAEDAKGLDRMKLLSWYGLAAQRMGEAGKKAEAMKMYAQLLALGGKTGEANVSSAGLFGLAKVGGEEAMADLVGAIGKGDVEVRNAALKAAGTLKGEAVTRKVLEAYAGGSSAVKVDVVGFLATRARDTAATEGVLNAISDKDEIVQVAGLNAVVKLAGEEANTALIFPAMTDGAAGDAAVKLLARQPGNRAMEMVGVMLREATAKQKVALMEVLAARVAVGQKEAVMGQAKDEAASVRVAAFKAMEKLASPGDVAGLLAVVNGTKDAAEQGAALKAAVAAALRGSNAEDNAAPFITAMAGADAAKHAVFASALPKVASAGGLAALVKDLESADKGIKDAAIRALGEWPEESAVAPLLGVAKSEGPVAQNVLAIRGVVQVVKGSKLGSAERVKQYESALAVCKRVEEKKLILGALSGEHSAEALGLAKSLMTGDDLKGEASLAVIRIVVPAEKGGAGLKGEEAVKALSEAVVVCPDEKLKVEAKKYLATIEPRK